MSVCVCVLSCCLHIIFQKIFFWSTFFAFASCQAFFLGVHPPLRYLSKENTTNNAKKHKAKKKEHKFFIFERGTHQNNSTAKFLFFIFFFCFSSQPRHPTTVHLRQVIRISCTLFFIIIIIIIIIIFFYHHHKSFHFAKTEKKLKHPKLSDHL